MPTGEQGALCGALCAVISAVILGVVVHARDRDWMDTYANTLSSGVLAAMALASLAFVPFTEQYARESVPPQRWNDPTFKRTHRMLTLMWGLAFGATAVLGYVAVKAPAREDWTDWVVPIVLIMAAIAVSQRFPSAGPVIHQP